jgi:hypothetical protein
MIIIDEVLPFDTTPALIRSLVLTFRFIIDSISLN